MTRKIVLGAAMLQQIRWRYPAVREAFPVFKRWDAVTSACCGKQHPQQRQIMTEIFQELAQLSAESCAHLKRLLGAQRVEFYLPQEGRAPRKIVI